MLWLHFYSSSLEHKCLTTLKIVGPTKTLHLHSACAGQSTILIAQTMMMLCLAANRNYLFCLNICWPKLHMALLTINLILQLSVGKINGILFAHLKERLSLGPECSGKSPTNEKDT